MQPKRPAPLAPEAVTHRVSPSMIRGILFEQLRDYIVDKLDAGYSQAELAVSLDLNQSHVSSIKNATRLETGWDCGLSTDRLLRACDRLDRIFVEIVIRGN